MTQEQIQATLALIDQNYSVIMVTGGIGFILGFVQFGEAFRLGFRHKSHAIPLISNLFYLANDATYELHYDRWFHELHHPFFMNGWYLNLPFAFLELCMAIQIVHYGWREVFPGLSKVQAYFAYAGLQIAMVIVYVWLSQALDDYLADEGNMITLIFSNLGLYLLVRRRSRRGQSLLLAGTLVICAGALQFYCLFPLLDPRLQTPAYYGLATLMTACGIAYFILLARTPPYVPVAETGGADAR